MRRWMLLIGRSGSIRETRTPATPLTARDMNPIDNQSSVRSKTSPIVSASGIQPQAANLGQSSPSIVTVDAIAQSQGKNASSSAAKKVMDWFRRKSMVNNSYSSSASAGLRNESTGSFVRVEPVQSPPTVATVDMSSTSSVAVILEEEQLVPPPPREEVPLPDSATLPTPSSRIPEPVRLPLAEAGNATNIARSSPQRQTIGSTGRSKSHHIGLTPGQVKSAPTPKASTPSAAARLRAEEAKLRIHTGVVDQSALSSKLPSEVISEVIKVLSEMGLEVKRENEFRLRCTRPKKGAARGGLRGSVMSMGGSSGGFLLGNASSSRVSPFSSERMLC